MLKIINAQTGNIVAVFEASKENPVERVEFVNETCKKMNASIQAQFEKYSQTKTESSVYVVIDTSGYDLTSTQYKNH